MLIPLLLVLAGLAVLTVGAELLVRGASALGLRCGLSPLVVGLTIVAFGTSAPELAVSVRAALEGNAGIAAGNIVGSNIFNIAVILGLAALVRPLEVHLQLLRWDTPILLVASLVFALFLVTGEGIGRLEAGTLFAAIVAYTAWAVRAARRETAGAATDPAIGEGLSTGRTLSDSMAASLLAVAVGLALLAGGARLLVDQAVVVATHLGVSETVIGLTIVAAGTSFPELAASLVAAWRRETDMAVGNIVGSNLFNVLAIGGTAGLVRPVERATLGWLDLGWMLGLTVVLVPVMWTGARITRREGVLLVASAGAYLFLRWPR